MVFVICLLRWLNRVEGMWLSVWLREIIRLRFVVLSKTTLFLTFGIVYHPLKIAPAIRWNMLLHKRFGRYRLYVMAIHECLARLSQFVRYWVRLCASTCHKHHQKLTLHMEKVIWAAALGLCGQMFQLCFFLIRNLIIINTDTSFGLYFKDESTSTESRLL